MNENNKLYAIWLQQVLGYASCKVIRILNKFGSIKNFYKSFYSEKLDSKILDKNHLEKIKNTTLASSEQTLKKCRELNINVISIEDQAYPKCLKEIYNPPVVLYTKGKALNIESNISLSLVGSRKSSGYGMEVAFNLAYQLAKCGINIISGGAIGIDTMALKGAISAKSSSIIAVVATGLDIYYPKSNEKLYKSIENNGTIVSEFPPSTTARPGYFPIRNRIMSGISNGVIIAQAAIKSGAIITANLALEQGREVFAVPGNINDSYSRGTNLLIKDGAIPVTDVQDILEVYGFDKKIVATNNLNHKVKPNKPQIKPQIKVDRVSRNAINVNYVLPAHVSLKAKKLYNVMTQSPEFLDELAKKAKLDIINAQSAAMELMVIKVIKSYSGGKYSK